MMQIAAGGMLGLLLGIAVQRCGLTERGDVSAAIGMRRHNLTRRVLMSVGWATVLTAFLSWLAVIDVDRLTVIPLHGGTILGGVIFGVAAGLTGLLPGTIPAIAGGGRFLEGLAGIAGGLIGAAALPYILPVVKGVQGLIPPSANTLFQVTLDEPYLFAGSFLGQGCVGLVMMAVALLIPPEPLPETEASETEAPETEPAAAAEEAPSTDAQDIQEDTVVALLPGEETVVVDTAAPEEETPPAEEKKENEDLAEEPPEKTKQSSADDAEEERMG